MRNHHFIAVLTLAIIRAAGGQAAEPVNLAPQAKVSASSEYSGDYLAEWAVDGKIPDLECKADKQQAWCVVGRKGMHGEFTLEWTRPVEVADQGL